MKRVIHNTVFQLIGTAASKLIGMGFVVVASRSLGAEGYGQYSLVFTFVSFFAMMASFGVPTIAVRELARDQADRRTVLGDIIVLKLALGGIAAVFCLAAVAAFGYGADLQLGIRIAALGLALSFLQGYDAYFQATLQMQYTVAAGVLRDAMLLGAAVLLARAGAGFLGYVWAGIAATAAASLLLFALGCRLVRPRFQLDRTRLLRLMKDSVPLGLASFTVYLYYNADTLMLSKLSTMAAVGFYAVAYKFVFLGQIVPGALVTSLFPGFARDAVHNLDKAEHNLRTTFGLFCYAAFGLAILGILYHRDAIRLLFGEGYLPAALPLLIFSISFVFMLPNILFSKFLVARGGQNFIFHTHLVSAALNIALNFYAIPRFGIAGAAVTTMVSDFVVFCAFFYKINAVAEYVALNLTRYVYLMFAGAALVGLGLIVRMPWQAEAGLITAAYLSYVLITDREPWQMVIRLVTGDR